MEEIVKLPHILTITKEPNSLDIPNISTEYKDIPCVYYLLYKNNVIKVGRTTDIYSRFADYRSEAKIYPEHKINGSWRTVKKLYEIMDVGETIEVYADFIKIKKQYEIHEGRRIYLTVDLRKTEKDEQDKYRETLLLK
jgi:hypothetical protein